jgi:RimJ/RimL family protein N-acetyltransferase
MIELKKINESNSGILQELVRVLLAAPQFALRTSGRIPTMENARAIFTDFPPGKSFEDKLVYGIFLKSKIIGLCDLILGYPNKSTAMLGLLLLSEEHHGKGFGRAAFTKICSALGAWPEVKKIRIGIVKTNSEVIPFWLAMGFTDTGLRKPYQENAVKSEIVVMEISL